jgi:hypothetical protein
MYSALIQPDIPIDKVNNLLLSPKITLQSGIGMAVRNVYFVIRMRQYNIYSANADLKDLYGQSSN